MDAGVPLTCTSGFVHQAEYSPDGKRLALATNLGQGLPSAGLILDIATNATANLDSMLPSRSGRQVYSVNWSSDNTVVVTEMWGTQLPAQHAYALTSIDLTTATVTGTVLLGNTKHDRPYHLVGAVGPNNWLVEPLVEHRSCAVYRYNPKTDVIEDCVLPGQDDDATQRAFCRPWVAKYTNSHPSRGEQTVTFMNIETAESKTISGVPLGADAALMTTDGRYAICASVGGDFTAQTPLVIDVSTGARTAYPLENWRPVALSSAGDRLLIGSPSRSSDGRVNWTYYQIELSSVLP